MQVKTEMKRNASLELQEDDTVKGQSRTRTPRSAHATRNVYSQLSGLEDVVFNDFIKDDFIPEGDGQVASGSEFLPDPVDLETDEQMLEREQNERDVLDALGQYKCDAGMSVEDVLRLLTSKH